MVVEILLYVVLVVIRYRYLYTIENYLETLHQRCLGHVYDKRAMGAQELWFGQILLEFLHRHERHDLLVVLKIETNVVLKSLNIQYIIETYSLQLVVALNEHKS